MHESFLDTLYYEFFSCFERKNWIGVYFCATEMVQKLIDQLRSTNWIWKEGFVRVNAIFKMKFIRSTNSSISSSNGSWSNFTWTERERDFAFAFHNLRNCEILQWQFSLFFMILSEKLEKILIDFERNLSYYRNWA